MSDTEIIKFLGGQTALAAQLGIASSRVGNWFSRGIPWEYRPEVANLIRAKDVKMVPANFLAPRKKPRKAA